MAAAAAAAAGNGGEGARWSEREFVCDVLKFWSGKSLHLLLWDGSDSVISMIGLNPG